MCAPTDLHPRDDHPRRGGGDEGVALVLSILFTIVVTGLVVSGTLLMQAHRAEIETSYRLHGQTAQFARAGVIEALAWFRKSSIQPVVDFEPVLDPSATPPVLETLDPDIGIVREFEISGPIWGRYEVWKQWDADPDPQRLAWRQKVQVEDISALAGAAGVGTVWRLQSVAYVYRRVDPNVAFDTWPNQVLGTDMLATEIRRLTLAPPGQAGLCARRGDAVRVVDRVSVQGGLGAGIYYESGTGSPSLSGGPRINGSPGISSGSPYDDSVTAVFGVAAPDLRTIADARISQAGDFPYPVATNSLYYVEVPLLDFTASRPLQGSAVIYVKGDVDFQAGNKSFFTGLLYVDGDLRMREPCEFNGTIVCTGNVRLEGQSDWVNVGYDDDALNRLRTEIGQYRLSGTFRRALAEE